MPSDQSKSQIDREAVAYIPPGSAIFLLLVMALLAPIVIRIKRAIRWVKE